MKRIFGLILAVSTATAHAYTGNQLLDLMQKDADPSYLMGATAYVRGFMDGGSYAQYLLKQQNATSGDLFCAPPGSSVSQGYDIVKQYLTNRPAERHNLAGALAAAALRNAWPCR